MEQAVEENGVGTTRAAPAHAPGKRGKTSKDVRHGHCVWSEVNRSTSNFALPPVLPSAPAYDHKDEEVSTEVGRVTTAAETPIFICVTDNCNRLFPSRERLAQHRKAIHNSTDASSDVITWNEE